MRNLFLVLSLTLPTLIFGQTLNDVVNFDSLNIDFINSELYKRISEKRKNLGFDKIVKDTIPIYAAKYHLTYFKQFKDLNEIHNENNFVNSNLYGEGLVLTVIPTPLIRLRCAEINVNNRDAALAEIKFQYEFVEEKTFSYKFNENTKIIYKELIDNVFIDLTNTQLLNYNLNNTNYFGLWNENVKDENNNVIYAITYVLSKK